MHFATICEIFLPKQAVFLFTKSNICVSFIKSGGKYAFLCCFLIKNNEILPCQRKANTYDITYMWNLKNYISEQTDAQTE